MQVQRLFDPKVGYQGQATKAIGPQQSGATPIASAIGQAAGAVGQFAQKYQQAKYDQNRDDMVLAIKQSINAYNEGLAVNPIRKQTLTDDIVELKESSWMNRADYIQKEIIDKSEDPRLAEEMTAWWASNTEDYRSQVVNNAIDEDISFMSKLRVENIQSAIERGPEGEQDYIDLMNTGLANGTISRSMADDLHDQKRFNDLLIKTTPMTIEEAEQAVNESDLDVEEKARAKGVIAERRKVREQDIKKTVDQYDSSNYLDLYMAAQNMEIRTSTQLEAVFRDMPNAMYGDEELSGTATDFAAKHMVSLMSVINSKNKDEKEPPAETQLTGRVKEDLLSVMDTSSREEVLQYTYDNLETEGYGNAALNYVLTEMNKGSRKRLTDTGTVAYDEGVKDLIKGEYITEDEKYPIRRKFDSWIQQFTDEEIITEAYFEKLPEFFTAMKAERTKYRIEDLQQNIMNYADGKLDYPEQFIRRGNIGDYVGQSDPKLLNEYINTPVGNLEALQDGTANYLYGKTYDQLDKDKQNRVDLSTAIAEHSKSVLRLAEQSIKPGGRVVIDPKTNMPKIRYGENEDYMLRINPETQEEEWWQFGQLSPNDTPKWYPANINIPITVKDPGLVRSTFTSVKDAADRLEDVGIEIPEESGYAQYLRDRLNIDTTIVPEGQLGNIFMRGRN